MSVFSRFASLSGLAALGDQSGQKWFLQELSHLPLYILSIFSPEFIRRDEHSGSWGMDGSISAESFLLGPAGKTASADGLERSVTQDEEEQALEIKG